MGAMKRLSQDYEQLCDHLITALDGGKKQPLRMFLYDLVEEEGADYAAEVVLQFTDLEAFWRLMDSYAPWQIVEAVARRTEAFYFAHREHVSQVDAGAVQLPMSLVGEIFQAKKLLDGVVGRYKANLAGKGD